MYPRTRPGSAAKPRLFAAGISSDLGDPDALPRLCRALNHHLARVSEPEAAARWVARRVAALRRPLGERDDDGRPELATARRLLAAARDDEAPLDERDLESFLRSCTRPDRVAAAAHLLVARGRFSRAREVGASLIGAPENADQHDPAIIHATALLHALDGRGPDARALAATLGERAVEVSDHQVCGRLLLQLGDPDRAAAHLEIAARRDGRPRTLELLATAAALSDDRAGVERATARLLGDPDDPDDAAPPGGLAAALDRLLDVGAFDTYESYLRGLRNAENPGARDDASLRLAALCLWRGELEAARALAQALAERPAARGILGAAAVLAREPAAALGHLDDAIASAPDDPALRLWRAQAVIDHGHAQGERRAQLDDDLERAAVRDHPALHLLRALHVGMARASAGPWGPTIAALIRSLTTDTSLATASASATTARAALSRLGGNRTRHVTVTRDPSSLGRAPTPTGLHARARALRDHVRVTPPRAALAALEALARDQPQSPYPVLELCELDLWLGEYERALARLDDLERDGVQWDPVRRGAALMLLGEADKALAAWDEGFRAESTALPIESVYVYRGELRRTRGDHAGARADLERAVRARPSRVGAWINLALLDLGERLPAEVALGRVAELAPALLREALTVSGRAPSTPLRDGDPGATAALERALTMMRGNRSAELCTFIDPAGVLRVLGPHDHAVWRRYASRSIEFATQSLRGWQLELLAARP